MRESELPAMDEKGWGKYGEEEPCKHMLALRVLLVQSKMTIYAEDSDGWVNVTCFVCGRTYETLLQLKEDFEEV